MTSGTPALPGLADLSPLGQGGLADVYLARQIHLERWVAAKVFRVTLDDEQAADRFRAECRALGRIDQYPHIITVYDAGVLPDGRPYLISERCDGSLADLVGVRGPLPAERITGLGLTVARALRFAHSTGVLHGDVTPQNILLRSSGAPVLADFGLAVLRDHRAAVAAGFTQSHAAPETLGDDRAIDEGSDVYGLGSTLYAALTGQPPFPRHPGEDDPEHVDRIRTEPVPEPEGAPPELAALLVAMLAKDPAGRPSTDDVVDTLGTIADGGATQAMRVPGAAAGWTGPAGTRTAFAPSTSGPATTRSPAPAARHDDGADRTRLEHPGPRRVGGAATTAAPAARPRRRGLLVGGVAAVLALLGGGVAAALWQGFGDPPTAAPTAPTSAPAVPARPQPTTAPTAPPSTSVAPRTTAPRRTTTPPPPTTAPDRDEPRRDGPGASASNRPSGPGRVPPGQGPANPGRGGPGREPPGRTTPGPVAPGPDDAGATDPAPADPGARSGAEQRGPSGAGARSAPAPSPEAAGTVTAPTG